MSLFHNQTRKHSFLGPISVPTPVKIRNSDYVVMLEMKNVTLDEVKMLQLTPQQPASALNLEFQVDMPEWPVINFHVVATYRKIPLTVPGVNWQICCWEWSFWRCPAHHVDLHGSIDISRFQAHVKVKFPIYQCAGNFFDQLGCLFQSPVQYLEALLENEFHYSLKRVVEMKVSDIDWSFQADKSTETRATYIQHANENPIFRTSDQEKHDLSHHASDTFDQWMTQDLDNSSYLEHVKTIFIQSINDGAEEILENTLDSSN